MGPDGDSMHPYPVHQVDRARLLARQHHPNHVAALGKARGQGVDRSGDPVELGRQVLVGEKTDVQLLLGRTEGRKPEEIPVLFFEPRTRSSPTGTVRRHPGIVVGARHVLSETLTSAWVETPGRDVLLQLGALELNVAR